MKILFNKFINYLTDRPKNLFIIDSFGAILTAFFLFVIIRQFNFFFGLPKKEITYLSLIAFCYSIYSTSCLLFLKNIGHLF